MLLSGKQEDFDGFNLGGWGATFNKFAKSMLFLVTTDTLN